MSENHSTPHRDDDKTQTENLHHHHDDHCITCESHHSILWPTHHTISELLTKLNNKENNDQILDMKQPQEQHDTNHHQIGSPNSGDESFEQLASPTTMAAHQLLSKKNTKRGIGLWKKTPTPSSSSQPPLVQNVVQVLSKAQHNHTSNDEAEDVNVDSSGSSSPEDEVLPHNYHPFGTPEPLISTTPKDHNTSSLTKSFSFHSKQTPGEKPQVVFVPHTKENSQHCFHTSVDEEMESFAVYDQLLSNNIEYVREKTKMDPEYFKKHKASQSPTFLLIGCSDSRVSCENIVKLDPGKMFIHRNVANLVVNTDLNLMSVLQYAVEVLNIKHVIVMGHTRCGGVKAALENTSHGLIDKWLRNIKDVYRLHKQEIDAIQDEDKRWQRMIELNVIEQTLNICKTSIIQKAWAMGKPIHVHGWVYDISTGLIQDLEIEENLWAPIESIYRIEFPNLQHSDE